MKPLLLFGGGGQLGRELMVLAAASGKRVVGRERAEANITDEAAVSAALDRSAPALVVNAAAYTQVDRAESEPDAATQVNALGSRVLARACAERGVPLLHFSTDYVFDGRKSGAYAEGDPVAPLGVYGRSKLAGEQEIRAHHDRHVILRTSWVYGQYGANFLKTMLRLAEQKKELRIVADQHGRPTSTMDLAQAVLRLAPILSRAGAPWGTYHFAGHGATTWYGFAQVIMAERKRILGSAPEVIPISTAEYPTPAQRPANSVLNTSLFERTFGFSAAPWRQRVREVVSALLGDKELIS